LFALLTIPPSPPARFATWLNALVDFFCDQGFFFCCLLGVIRGSLLGEHFLPTPARSVVCSVPPSFFILEVCTIRLLPSCPISLINKEPNINACGLLLCAPSQQALPTCPFGDGLFAQRLNIMPHRWAVFDAPRDSPFSRALLCVRTCYLLRRGNLHRFGLFF